MNRKRLGVALSIGTGAFAALALLGLLGCLGGVATAEPERSGQSDTVASATGEPIVSARTAATSIRYVTLSGADAGDCATPFSACRTLQYAVDQAGEGDEVRVASGVYSGVNSYAGLAQVVYLSKTVSLRGGYTVTNWTAADPQAHPTVLDAGRQGRVLAIVGHISPTIEGLHITRGDAAGLGGATESGADAGGGIYVISATPTIRNNYVFSNTAQVGGGLFLYNSSSIFEGNIIMANAVITNGGGLALLRSDATFVNNVVAANSATGAGSGLYIGGASVRLFHTTIARNGGDGGNGVYVTGADEDGGHYASSVALTNTILVSHGVGISVTAGDTAAIHGVLWYGNLRDTGGGGTITINHAITDDPALAPDGAHITPASAALDAGVPSGVSSDIDGHHRPYNTLPDLGADEIIAITAGAGLSNTLVYTESGGSTLVQAPAGVVSGSVMLVYTPRETATAPAGLRFAGRAFDLQAYRDGALLSGLTFSAPITVTIRYAEAEAARVYEDTLELRYWDGEAWVDVATACDPASAYERHPAENWFAVPVCHLSRFATFGVPREYHVFLPLVVRGIPDDTPPPPSPAPPAGFARWRSADGGFDDWERDGVRLNADGRLALDLANAHADSDPYSPGGYYGHNFYNGGAFKVGEAHSPVMTAPFSFSEAVASWNADTPQGTWIETLARAQLGDRWTKWYNLGVWAADTSTVERHSVNLQGDADAYVAVDTLVVTNDAEPVSAYQLKLRLFSADEFAVPSIRNISFAFSETLDATGPYPPGNPDLWDRVLPVPQCSQMIYPDGGTVWCSPTSTSMVLGYWLQDSSSCETRVRAAVAGVYDWLYDGHGNWPFNTAYAATYDLEGYVVRFTSLSQAESWIAAGVPVIFSLAWGPGELTGAPLTSSSGHLMVLVGFDADGDPVVNDPAAPGDDSVRRTYLREEFEPLWLEHTNGTVYLIYPPGWSVPDL